MTILISGLVGLLIGLLLAAYLVYTRAPGMMIVRSESARDFDATVEALTHAAEQAGWRVPIVHRLDESVKKAGFEVAPAAVIEACRAPLAGRIMSDEKSRFVASMMPCRIAVTQEADGKVVVSRMNTALMSKLFGGLIQEVMADATAESETIVAAVESVAEQAAPELA